MAFFGPRVDRYLRVLVSIGFLAALLLTARAEAAAPFSPSWFGVNGTPGTTGSPPGILSAYQRAQEANLQWVRIFFPWWQIEASNGVFNWDTAQTGPTDWCACGGCPSIAQKIQAARAAGRSIVGVLTETPTWLGGGANHNNPPPAGYFERFAREAALRFANDVAVWELWNEPNLPEHWSGSAMQYRNLILIPGRNAIKAAVPSAKVAAPAVNNPSTTTLNNFLGVSGGNFAVPIDIVSTHHYGSVTNVINQGNAVGAWCDPKPGCLDWWITEFGFASTGCCGACAQGAISGAPGDDLVTIIRRCELNANPNEWLWCGKAMIFNLHDRTNLNGSCTNPGGIGCDLGLLKADGTIRKKICKVEFYTTGTYLTPGCP